VVTEWISEGQGSGAECGVRSAESISLATGCPTLWSWERLLVSLVKWRRWDIGRCSCRYLYMNVRGSLMICFPQIKEPLAQMRRVTSHGSLLVADDHGQQ
jgi:hypothetical protein